MTERQVASKTFGGYIILHTIGKGEFGKVKLAYDPNKDLEVAIKFIKRSNITSAQKQAKLEREINILQVSLKIKIKYLENNRKNTNIYFVSLF